ncbi:hypothetical protein E2320_000923 [Naja naja]|nr:hypothetical protein E2320_000923 [Naja naja]
MPRRRRARCPPLAGLHFGVSQVLRRGFQLPGVHHLGVLAPLEEEVGLSGCIQEGGPGHALGLTDVPDLVVLIVAGVEGPAEVQLSHHTAQGPHVQLLAERQPQQDFWGPVESGLDVRLFDIAHFVEDAGRSKINHLDPERVPHLVHQHDVLRL